MRAMAGLGAAGVIFSLLTVQAAATVSDGSCLLQAHADVAQQQQVASEQSTQSGLMGELVNTLRTASEQIPLPLMGGAGAGKGMFSQDLMAMGLELLGLFQNKSVVGMMKKDMRAVTTGLYTETRRLGSGATALAAAAANATSQDEVLDLLKGYFQSYVHEMATMAANATVASRSLTNELPPKTKLRRVARPVEAIGLFGKAQIAGIIENFVLQSSEEDFASADNFCAKFEPVQGNLTRTAEFLKKNSTGLVEKLRAVLPKVYPLLLAFSPEAAGTVFWFANTTLDDVAPVLLAAKEEVPAVATALHQVTTRHLGCSFKTTQSVASPLARRGLSLLLAALSAVAAAA